MILKNPAKTLKLSSGRASGARSILLQGVGVRARVSPLLRARI